MTVPDSVRRAGRNHCVDMLKFFVNAELTSYAMLGLGILDSGSGNQTRCTHTPLSDFLDSLAVPHRGPEHEAVIDKGEWVTKNCIICIKVAGHDAARSHDI